MTTRAIFMCRIGVLLIALLCLLVSAGILFAHPEHNISFFFDLTGLLILLFAASPYLGLAALVKWQSCPSGAHCTVLVLGALGVGFISFLSWDLAIDTWPSAMSFLSQIIFKMPQWLVIISTALLLIIVSFVQNYLQRRKSK